MNNLANHDEKYKKIALTLVEILIVSIVAMLIEAVYLGFSNWNFRVPISYNGGDAFSGIASMRMRMLGDGNRLGWPYYEDLSKYGPIISGIYLIGSTIINLYVDDFNVGQNLILFFIPTINIVSSYFVFINMKMRRWLAFLGALVFGLSPYVQVRLFLHKDIAAVECIPLAFLMCFWLLEDDSFAIPGKSYLKNRRNILLIIFSWLIANNGLVYYPFFSCFILLVTGMMNTINKRDIKRIVPAIVCILNIVLWLGVGFLPALFGAISGHGDVATNGTTRNAFRSTIYGLDIKSLFLSPNGFGFDKIKGFYDYLFINGYEQFYSYFGIVGIIGLIILFLGLLINKESNDIVTKRIVLLSRLNIMLILLGVSGGLGVIVALFIPFIASYNRLSIFMLFASITTVLLLINSFIEKNRDSLKRKIFITAFALFVLLYGFLEQRKCYAYLSTDLLLSNATQLTQDRQFFAELEQEAGENAMVYMLPYMRSFENGPAGSVNDYEQYRGYMNTNTIRWSYGAIFGGKNDQWNFATSQLPYSEMIQELRDKGFAGIYINMAGYDGDSGLDVANGILDALGSEEVIIHENKYILYIPIN